MFARTRALPLMVLAALSASAGNASAQTWTTPTSPYRLWPGPDLGLLAATTTLWIMPTLVMHNQIKPPDCALTACDPADVNVLDRQFIQFHNPAGRWAAEGMFLAMPILWGGLELGDVGWHDWKTVLLDFGILAEALAWSGAVDEIFRHAVHRPRPYLYVAGVYPDSRLEGEATFSYYSGHTSAWFAFSVTTAYTFTLRHPHSPWRYPVWIGLLAAGALQGVFRVWSGDHFPTDVLTGMLVGSAIGIAVPTLHLRPADAKVWLVPSVSEGAATVWLGGSF